MKRITVITIIAAISLAAATALACGEKTRPPKPPCCSKAAELSQLGLSADQEKQVKELMGKSHEKAGELVEALRAEEEKLQDLSHGKTVDERAIVDQAAKVGTAKGALALHRAKSFQQLQSILTPQQLKAFIDGFHGRFAGPEGDFHRCGHHNEASGQCCSQKHHKCCDEPRKHLGKHGGKNGDNCKFKTCDCCGKATTPDCCDKPAGPDCCKGARK